MRRKRAALQEADFVQTKLYVPKSVASRLQWLKARYGMRGYDTVAAAMIRRAMVDFDTADLVVPPPPADADERLHELALNLPRDHYEFVQAVARRNRGVSLGVALETIAEHVKDLTAPPLQLSLIEGGSAVSG